PPADVVAALGKTEGNGGVSDFSRGLAAQKLGALLAGYLGQDAAGRIACVMSGGTEGVLSPHLTVISRTRTVAEGERRHDKALAVGVARTPALEPQMIGRSVQVELVAAAVK